MRLSLLAASVILATAAGAASPVSVMTDKPEFASSAQSQAAVAMPVIDPSAPIGKGCPPTSRTEAARRGGRLDAQPLDELPPADMYMAVDRRVDGCQAPIIAGYGFGGPDIGLTLAGRR